MLTKVLKLGSLNDKLVNLVCDAQLVIWSEISPSEFLRYAVEHFDCPGVLHFGHLMGPIAVSDATRRRG